ncbi:MAG: serine/threonine-protein kinase HipA [Candidatus Pelagisphaera sp.]|jgi:serine/threonine-protein kinase HipA
MAHDLAEVFYKTHRVAAVYWDASKGCASFRYDPDFVASGQQLAPIKMPLSNRTYQFSRLDESFQGLPGLLADCLPDTFGNALIDQWLRSQSRSPHDFNPVERLCYMGKRSMGALEFKPALASKNPESEPIEIDRLVNLASKTLAIKEGLDTHLDDSDGLQQILQVGTSAGGARAKAVIAWNKESGEVRSGQSDCPAGFSHWLLKFDGVHSSFEGVRDPKGYGRIEYAYHLMAQEAGIEMAPCRLLEENGRAHFMTKRFDRASDGQKLHYASLFGIAHMPYLAPGAHSHSYEDLFEIIEQLNLPKVDQLQAFRRMVFNVLALNKDDHVKNFGFLLNEGWRLSPAFDVSYAHNPGPGKWTATQQTSLRGKRENIELPDFIQFAKDHSLATLPKIKSIIEQVAQSIRKWPQFAEQAKISEQTALKIQTALDASLKQSVDFH